MMNDTQENLLILNFLKKNYPVYRVKENNRFKRTITLDNGQNYFLSDKRSIEGLYLNLLKTVEKIFNIERKKAEIPLKTFLNIKN